MSIIIISKINSMIGCKIVLNCNVKKAYNIYVYKLYIILIILGFVMASNNKKQATFGAGCFWCVEAIFEQIEGVLDVRSGYAGGTTKNPTYKDVCSGRTGHVEVIQIDFNPQIITYEDLLDILWKSHDPTTVNKQGRDIGSQYRSAIFYHSEQQRIAAEESKKKMDKSGKYSDSIVTEIIPIGSFYKAENYHQDYYRLNKEAPYCQLVIAPKLKKIFN